MAPSFFPSLARGHRFLESVFIVPGLVLSIIIAMTVWFAYDERARVLDHEYRVLEAHTRLAEQQLAAQFTGIERLLRQIGEEAPSAFQQDAAAYGAVLAERQRGMPELLTLALIDGEGRVEASALPSLRGLDASRRDYFTAHQAPTNESGFHITRPFRSAFRDDTIVFSAAIRDAEKRLLGVAAAGVKQQLFESVLTRALPPDQGCVATVFNQAGDPLYRHPDSERSLGTDIPFPQLPSANQPAQRHIAVIGSDGGKRIYVHRTVGNTGLSVAVSHPLDKVLAEWRRHTILRALIAALASAVTLFLVWMVRRRQREITSGEAFTKRLIETVNVMLVSFNAKGEVVAFNATAEAVSGYRRDEIIGRKWFETVLPPGHDAETGRLLQAASGDGQIPPAIDYPILTKDGRKRLISWRNTPILDGQKTVATISFGVDITEHGQVEKIRRSAEVSRRLVSIQEEERRRLAVELHDRTSPNLCALEINWRLLANSVRDDLPDDAAHLLDDASALIDDTIQSIRTISTEFRPPVLDHAGFWPAVEGYAKQFNRRTGIVVRIEDKAAKAAKEAANVAGHAAGNAQLPKEVETNLFRIVQEALSNCAKHSQAKTISIEQEVRGDCLGLSIIDDGCGFDPQQLPAPGQGLLMMQKRAEFIGGRFSLETRPGSGTRISVELQAAEFVRPPAPPVRSNAVA